MTSIAHAGLAPDEPVSRTSSHADAPLRLEILAYAILLGVVGDALMREPGSGVAFPIWIALLALSAVAIVSRRRTVARETAFWLMTAVVFAGFAAWRASMTLQSMDILATGGALGMAAIAIADDKAALLARRLRDTIWAGVDVMRSVAAGVLPVAMHSMTGPVLRARASDRVRPALRASVFAVVLLVVFGTLLRSADPLFASLVDIPDFDAQVVLSHIVLTGFYTWLVAGWLRGALRVDREAPRPPDALPFTFSSLDITTALATLIVLFSVFVASQVGLFFGGDEFLRQRTGLTAASYARQGFFQLVWAVTLVLPVLMVTRGAQRDDAATARRHTVLALPLIGLLGATMVSAVARMKLYVHYYGLTTDRLYPLVFMGWLAVVLTWFACTVLRNRPRSFVGGALLTGAAVLAALNLSDPDAIVARANLSRAAQNPTRADSSLDLVYLSRLSGAAVPLAVNATLASPPLAPDAQRCAAARQLLRSWGPASRRAERQGRMASWRQWNADEAEAMRVVTAHATSLRLVQHQSCARRPVATAAAPGAVHSAD